MTMPTTANLGEPQPGDEDLSVIIVRRTTLEWVLRRAAIASPSVELRTAAAVAGLVGDTSGPTPVVTGVRLDDGTTIDGDIVIASTGRRGDVPAWLRPLGVDVSETVHESGLMYLSRWYHLPEGFDLGTDPKLGGDLGFVKFLGVPGDGDTLSITLAIRPDDSELRAALSDPDGFEHACRLLPGPNRFFVDGPLEPLGGVRPMGGLLNRLRRFVDADGQPTVLGFHAVGDAHTCTNPLYGRGCSLAMVQAVLLADAAAAHPGDPAGRAAEYEAACAREVEPWYEVSLEMDRMGADPSGPAASGDKSGEQPSAFAAVMAAAATDPVIGRGMARFWNLLVTPAELMQDTEYVARVAQVMADPGAYPLPPNEGPTRRELLDALTDNERASA
jgi:2-polyprenyl-6-methoxyphenol hydroxylase-like FAD-dependent oxidoreductase